MKSDISSYVPFLHNNFQYIKKVIEIARTQDNNKIDGALTSTLIYINAIDYISSHIVQNLYEITFLVTNFEFGGIVSMDNTISRNLPLGELINELKKFDFPNKDLLISDLKEFKTLRNKVAHNLLSLSNDELGKIDSDLTNIRVIGERIINTYDTIVRGITSTWTSYKSGKFAQVPDNTPINPNEEEPKPQKAESKKKPSKKSK